MKCAVVLADGVKQVMFTPENENEKMALKMFSGKQDISVEFKEGSFYSGFHGHNQQTLRSYNVALCQGGYARAFEDSDSLMLVLVDKEPEADK